MQREVVEAGEVAVAGEAVAAPLQLLTLPHSRGLRRMGTQPALEQQQGRVWVVQAEVGPPSGVAEGVVVVQQLQVAEVLVGEVAVAGGPGLCQLLRAQGTLQGKTLSLPLSQSQRRVAATKARMLQGYLHMRLPPAMARQQQVRRIRQQELQPHVVGEEAGVGGVQAGGRPDPQTAPHLLQPLLQHSLSPMLGGLQQQPTVALLTQLLTPQSCSQQAQVPWVRASLQEGPSQGLTAPLVPRAMQVHLPRAQQISRLRVQPLQRL
jgi:hypothetical protein